MEIPAGKLVPTLPNRLNYLLWLEDVVGALQLADDETVTGLDVGGCRVGGPQSAPPPPDGPRRGTARPPAARCPPRLRVQCAGAAGSAGSSRRANTNRVPHRLYGAVHRCGLPPDRGGHV